MRLWPWKRAASCELERTPYINMSGIYTTGQKDFCPLRLSRLCMKTDSEIGQFQAYLPHYHLSRDYSLFVMSNGHSRLLAFCALASMTLLPFSTGQ